MIPNASIQNLFNRLSRATGFVWIVLLQVIGPCQVYCQTMDPGKEFTQVSFDFRVVARMIVVKAIVDGVHGNFIIDTGSPELILNATHFESISKRPAISGISGQEVATMRRYVAFEWGPFYVKSKRAFVVDLSHLEGDRNFQFHGIIGYSLLKAYEIELNYTNHQLTLFCLDKKGNHLTPAVLLERIDHTMVLQMKGHLACVAMMVGTYEMCLAIDTGAGLNVFSEKYQEGLAAFLTDERALTLNGLVRRTNNASAALVNGLSIGDLGCAPMRTTFRNLDQLNAQDGLRSIDGFLGYEFLKQWTTSINYRKREFKIWRTHEFVRKGVE